MRILVVSNVRMIRELGAGRLQLETAEKLRRRGHEVETFDDRQAFGDRTPPRWQRRLRPTLFGAKARSYVQKTRFDVIEALEGNLPYPKTELDILACLLVVRSPGTLRHLR